MTVLGLNEHGFFSKPLRAGIGVSVPRPPAAPIPSRSSLTKFKYPCNPFFIYKALHD